VLTDVIRRFQRYDPVTGRFDADRSQGEYARLLGVSPAFISYLLSGEREPGTKVIQALVQVFPIAGQDILVALAAPEPEPADEAVVALAR